MQAINTIDIGRGDPLTDFSQGFYLTSIYQQALAFARRMANRFNRHGYTNTIPIIIKYKLDIDRIKQLNGKIFYSPNSEWAEFVYNNRIGDEKYIYSDLHNINKIYDYVYGHLADGKISEIIDFYKENYSYYPNNFIEKFKGDIFPKYPNNNDQLSLHTRHAINCLKFLEVMKDGNYNYPANHRRR